MSGVRPEWKDLRIDIKVCGKDVPEEEQTFVQYFPQVPYALPMDQISIETPNPKCRIFLRPLATTAHWVNTDIPKKISKMDDISKEVANRL